MAFSPTDSALYGPLFGDPDLALLFSDEQFVRYLLEVEAVLARVQGRLGVIPADAALRIESAAGALTVDFQALSAGVERAGLPIVDLVRQLRQAVGDEIARSVHRGTTTQDIMDTALVLQLEAALNLMAARLRAVIGRLAGLSDQHRRTLMAGRTHSQQALPITFGLKAAGWLAPLLRHLQRLNELEPRLMVVQFGGAAGTLASLGESGMAVQQALADALNLNVPLMPWHTQRDNLAELAGWLSMLSGSLAKMAQDIILLAQSEVGEVRESADRTRGGSSAMPQKSNPVVSELVVAAARTNASLLSALHGALIQEHERATHGWQMEWLSLPQMIALTGSALNNSLFLTENLVVDANRMRRNVASSAGLMLAEAAGVALSAHLNPDEAKRQVRRAVQVAIDTERHLIDVLRESNEAPVDWDALKDESAHLGMAEAFIDRVVAEAKRLLEIEPA